MIPYAIITAVALFLGYIVSFVAYAFSIDEKLLKFSYLPRFFIILVALGLTYWAVRKWNCRKHRLLSRNPAMRLISSDDKLVLLKSGDARLELTMTVKPLQQGISSMKLWVGWLGPLTDATIVKQHRCKIALTPSVRSIGLNVDARFAKGLEKGVEYSFEYALLFKNIAGKIGPFMAKKGEYFPEKKMNQTLEVQGKSGGFVRQVFSGGNNDPEFDVAKSTKNIVGQKSSDTWAVTLPRHGFVYKLSFYED